MKTYWDTSAAINAAISQDVFRRLDRGSHVTRLHLLAEFFATMTGRGVEIKDEAGNPARLVFTQNNCAAWLKMFAQRVQFEELTAEESLEALSCAESLGVQGSAIYDYWHALVAEKTKADELITRNTRHFEHLTKNVAWP